MANNAEVCHAWAHSTNKGVDGNHLYCSCNGELVSYRTCIGQHIELGGKTIFILDMNSYSNSTAKHQRHMIDAVPSKDDNVFTFFAPAPKFGRNRFVWPLEKDQMKHDLLKFGLQMLAKEYINCLKVQVCNKLNCGFSRNGFLEMCRLFRVTGVATINKLLRMKAGDFANLASSAVYACNGSWSERMSSEKQFKKFLRLMSDNTSIPEIVDAINGNGTWDAYQKRITRLRSADKNRKLGAYIGFGGHSKYNDAYIKFVSGSITEKDIKKHKKDGDLIQWLLETRRNNLKQINAHNEESERKHRMSIAKSKLAYHCGMCGWENFWSTGQSASDSFNYDGTTIDFSNTTGRCYQPRYLSDFEYLEFLETEDKATWIHNKRLWMLSMLQQDKVTYDERQARLDEEEKFKILEAERLWRLNQEKVGRYAELRNAGDEGLRQLYREGFSVSLPYGDAAIYDNGNVLLRYNEIRNVVETSKGVRLNVDECKRLWKIFKRWHDNNECTKGFDIKAVGAHYSVHSFDHNILVAGCHSIAYSEMQYIANLLNFD